MKFLLSCLALLLLQPSLCIAQSSDKENPAEYSVAYAGETLYAVNFYRDNYSIFKKHFPGMDEGALKVVYAVVAPEVSQYDPLADFFEVKALQMKYVKDGNCDYSVGYFQMKPSFAESIEKEISGNAALCDRYGKMFAYAADSEREQRRERVCRLCSLDWQVRYLAVFVEFVKRRTAGWGRADDEERLRCWATLYNAGRYLSRNRVLQRQGVKQFPRGTREFNYSSVSLEFYRRLMEKQ